MLRLYFVRHGESEANILHEFSNRGYKHPLTAKGVEQVELLAAKLLSEEHGPVLAIYSSPLLRAAQSAEILSRRLGTHYEIAPALIEYDVGIYEGRSDEEGWQRYNEVLQEWLVKGNHEARMEGGESFNDIEARFIPFIDSLRAAHATRDGSVILMGHGGTYRCILPLILPQVDFAFTLNNHIANTSYVLAELEEESHICSRWGEIEFEKG